MLLEQRLVARFIKKIKGRRGVKRVREDISIETLKDRRKNHRTQLLTKILSDEHKSLCSAYELTTNRDKNTMTTRAAIRYEVSRLQHMPRQKSIITVP